METVTKEYEEQIKIQSVIKNLTIIKDTKAQFIAYHNLRKLTLISKDNYDA